MAATNEKTNKLLANLMAVASGEAEIAELLLKLKNLAESGDVQALAFLEKLEEDHRCPINFELLEDPVRIEVRKEDGTLFIEPAIYNRASIQTETKSPLSRRRIERIIDPKTTPEAFKEFYAKACAEIALFFGKRQLIQRNLKGSPKLDGAATPPRSASPASSPLEEQNAQRQSQIEQIRNQCESIQTRMNNILDNNNDDSLQTMKSKFQNLFSESSMLNPKIANLSRQTSEVNSDLIRQQQELYALLGGLQSKLRRAIEIISTSPSPSLQQSSSSSSAMSSAQSSAQSQWMQPQAIPQAANSALVGYAASYPIQQNGQNPAAPLWMPPQTSSAAVSGSPIEPAVGYPVHHDQQNPTAPLMAPAPITPPSQQSSSPSSAISSMPEAPQPYQPVSAPSQPAVTANLQTSAEIQAQMQILRLQIITEAINRDALLKESFRVGSNNGQLTIRESSEINLTADNYQRLYQTLRDTLNTALPGISWTLDTVPISNLSHQTVQVNRMNLIFPGQNLALQPQYPTAQPRYPQAQLQQCLAPSQQIQQQFQQQFQQHSQQIQQYGEQARQHYQQLQQQHHQQAQQQLYPAAQPRYPAVSFFQPAYSRYQAGRTLQPGQASHNGTATSYPSPFNNNNNS